MQSRATNGFTLVELLITIGVAALLLGLAVPSFISVIKNSNMTSSVNEMVASMQLARSEAIKRRVPVTICRSATAESAQPQCADGDNWQNGWIVFVDDADNNGDGTADGDGVIDDGENILRVRRALSDRMRVLVPANSAPLDQRLTYRPSGFPRTAGPGAGRNLLFCDDRNQDYSGRVVNLTQTGRPNVVRVADVTNLGVSCDAN